MAIRFFEEEVKAGLLQRNSLKRFLTEKAFFYLEIKDLDISYIFCNDEYLLAKNIAFLQHDTLTDIITFDLTETEQELVAELYISTERVKENAAIFEVSYSQELHRVIFHGLLHLFGFGDKSAAEQKEMREMEAKFLNEYLG